MGVRELGRLVVLRKKYTNIESFWNSTRYYVQVVGVGDSLALEIGPMDRDEWESLEVGQEYLLVDGYLERN